MIFSLKGIVTYKTNKHIAIETNGVSYFLLVPKIDIYNIGSEYLIYTYLVIKEEELFLIGFNTLEDKELFLLLITVSGLGPKTACGILGASDSETIKSSISSCNISFLKNLPNVGLKLANQIVLDLTNKLSNQKADIKRYEEVTFALRKLGYKNKVIEETLSTINIPGASIEEILSLALKRIGNK